MKKYLHCFGFVAVTAIATSAFTSCSSEDEDFLDYAAQQSESPLSRAASAAGDITIGFEDYAENDVLIANPTSYGANLYASYTGDKFTEGALLLKDDNYVLFGINKIDGAYNFWNGGVALSNWAILKNQNSSQSADWWYSYNNQCSVYNTEARGIRRGAGAGGSDIFAIVYGYQDKYNQSYMSLPEISFLTPVTLKSLEYCNSSYVYGVLENGNQFGDSIIVNVPQIKKDKGYFRVTMYCYDANENLIAQRSKYLADYQDNHSEVAPVHTWTMWNLAEDGGAISRVQKIKFNFDGSNNSAWGLNTPAYICIDNITVSY